MRQNPVIFVLVGAAILIGLFFLLKPKTQQSQSLSSQVATQESSPSASTNTNLKTFELVVKNKKLISGFDTIKVSQGDEVSLKITNDEDEEFHLHGYEQKIDLKKDEPAELKFKANLSGRFEYELEKSGTELGALEVSPK